MIQLQGQAVGLSTDIVARVALRMRKPLTEWPVRTVLVTDDLPHRLGMHSAVLTPAPPSPAWRHLRGVGGLSRQALSDLRADDIVAIGPSGRIRKVWDSMASDNALVVTYACDCNCVMCPQPLQQTLSDQTAINSEILSLARNTHVQTIALTGGEPTLVPAAVCDLLDICKRRFPTTAVALLTNGRRLHDISIARQIAAVGHPLLTFCVSLHSDVPVVHDGLMGHMGSFGQTMEGMHNLARLRQRVEVRVVISRDNAARLGQLSEFVYRNLPFASHVAFMGMEITGRAHENATRLWADPTDYEAQLELAVHHLWQRDLHVSVYNIPLCLLPTSLWPFARKSISRWKVLFLDECRACVVRDMCGGVFATSSRHSPGIQAVADAASVSCHP